MELLWEVAADAGGTFNEQERPRIVTEKDVLCEALIHIHARAVLVASERRAASSINSALPQAKPGPSDLD